jgi:ADP-heptose:LPS heptosyltransferase
MELSRNAEFMKELGYTDFGLSLPHFHTRAIVRRKELAKLSYIVLFPGANWEGRQWPARRFADIASKVYKETGLISVVCGRPADKKLAEEISTSTDTPVVDLTGKTSLCELIGAIAGAVAVVTNETSAVHIAAAVNTPSVCILGGGHFGRFMPYPLDMPNSGGGLPMPVFHTMSCFNCEWKCPYIGQKNQEKLPAPCIEAISSKNVYMQLMKCLNSQARDSKFCLSHKCL